MAVVASLAGAAFGQYQMAPVVPVPLAGALPASVIAPAGPILPSASLSLAPVAPTLGASKLVVARRLKADLSSVFSRAAPAAEPLAAGAEGPSAYQQWRTMRHVQSALRLAAADKPLSRRRLDDLAARLRTWGGPEAKAMIEAFESDGKSVPEFPLLAAWFADPMSERYPGVLHAAIGRALRRRHSRLAGFLIESAFPDRYLVARRGELARLINDPIGFNSGPFHGTTLLELARLFARPAAAPLRRELRMLIEQASEYVSDRLDRERGYLTDEIADTSALALLGRDVFGKPHAAAWDEEALLFVYKTHANDHWALGQLVPEAVEAHAADWPRAMRKLLEIDDMELRHSVWRRFDSNLMRGIERSSIAQPLRGIYIASHGFRGGSKRDRHAARLRFLREKLGPFEEGVKPLAD